MNTERIEKVMDSPAASYWLKSALEDALKRDPVDSLNDAEYLVDLLSERFNLILKQTPS